MAKPQADYGNKVQKKNHIIGSLFLNGADEENRTPVKSLEGFSSTIKLHLQHEIILTYNVGKIKEKI